MSYAPMIVPRRTFDAAQRFSTGQDDEGKVPNRASVPISVFPIRFFALTDSLRAV